MRLIDADALKEWAVEIECGGRWGISIDELKDAIEDAPTIDPVKRGEWTKHILKNANVPWGYDCSACDGWFVVGEDVIKKYHFCPWCGAKMDGDADV